jgi:hypothetical protein
VLPVHYPELATRFRPVLEKHRLPLGMYSQTFPQTVKRHFQHIVDVNRAPAGSGGAVRGVK